MTTGSDGLSASQSGIISCIAVNAALPSVYAAASYLKTIGNDMFRRATKKKGKGTRVWLQIIDQDCIRSLTEQLCACWRGTKEA